MGSRGRQEAPGRGCCDPWRLKQASHVGWDGLADGGARGSQGAVGGGLRLGFGLALTTAEDWEARGAEARSMECAGAGEVEGEGGRMLGRVGLGGARMARGRRLL